jgi:hypothetical protein
MRAVKTLLVFVIAVAAVSLATALAVQTPNETSDYADAASAEVALGQAQEALGRAKVGIGQAEVAVGEAKATVKKIHDRNVPPPPQEEPPVEEPPVEEPPTEEPPPPPTGTVLFRDDFNKIPAAHTVSGGWYAQCNPGRMSVVPITSTNNAVRMEVRTGENETDTGNPRCELSGGPSELKAGANGGNGYWIYDRLRVSTSDTANPSWELWDQWHDGGPSGSQYSPSVALFRYGSDVRFINGKGSPVYWSGKAIERGTWHTLVYHYILSTGTTGLVESWWDGVKQPTFTGKTSNTGQAYLKIGINSSNTRSGTSLVEHDKVVVATTKAAAES